MKTYHEIDWLQFSSKTDFHHELEGNWMDAKPYNGYNVCKVDELGINHLWHTEYPQMKRLTVLSGKALQQTRLSGTNDIDLLRDAMFKIGAKFSRIDIALTIEHENPQKALTPHILHHMALHGELDSKLKLDNPVITPNGEIQTCYIGSRKARNRLFRAYDKGIELGLEADRIIRLELQTNKGADKIAVDIASGNNFAGLIRRYVDFPNWKAWVETLDHEPISNWKQAPHVHSLRDKLNEENSRRWEWIMSSVAPALAKAMHISEELSGTSEPDIEKFLRAVEFHKHKLQFDKP